MEIDIFLIINIFLIVGLVFFERRNPTAALGWVLILLVIPILGFFLYLVFGQNFYKKKLSKIKAEDDLELHTIIAEQKAELADRRIHLPDKRLESYRGMISMLLENNMAYLSQNNLVTVFDDGNALYSDLLAAIGKARHHIHMEYYIIRNDELGRKVVSALAAKAREGVEVRLLCDGLGTKLPKKVLQELRSAGGKTAFFFPSLIPVINLRMNYRNHRKIAVIDGTTGVIGGFNIGDEYLGKGPLGYWRDAALKVEGWAVYSMQMRFLMDWNYASGDTLGFSPGYFPEFAGSGSVAMQVVSSGPDARWNQIKAGYLKLINSAKESVYIQSPYFIPDESVLDALRIAALSGVDVRIMIPVKPDHPFVYWSGYSFIGDLLDSGVKAYTYDNGFIHAKTVVVDGIVASVGSANWDVRSFRLNFEANAFVYDTQCAGRLKDLFERDLAGCTEITQERYKARPIRVKFKESISRLFSPLL
ncbi:MAG: cardiolipin synthase [Methanoregulaceae archaeon]|nr:cardiolipin synthase [Methanoregulaceae archaeon]